MSHLPIRPYQPQDEADMLSLWNSCMWADPLDQTAWRGTWLLDANFDPDLCLLALPDGSPRGFALVMTNHLIDPNAAWLVGLGVDRHWRRQGIATELVQTLLARLADRNIATLHVGWYLPSYLTPGVDVAAYADGVAFFESIGAPKSSDSISMRAILTNYRAIDSVEGIRQKLGANNTVVRPPIASDILPLNHFLMEHFPHWKGDAFGVLRDHLAGDPKYTTFHIAQQGDQIVGFAQSRQERFGPFGVSEKCRGQGIGAVLLSDTLVSMRARGYHAAWFLWTSERAAKLYHQHGFEEVRRFAMISKKDFTENNS